MLSKNRVVADVRAGRKASARETVVDHWRPPKRDHVMQISLLLRDTSARQKLKE